MEKKNVDMQRRIHREIPFGRVAAVWKIELQTMAVYERVVPVVMRADLMAAVDQVGWAALSSATTPAT
ncbi:hypothetical protein EJ110_NYTH04026 [Nymphaea thermarum]|nr:hypothetical protein EJ110_NYTH04026 [Nymphaea thermarum]